MASDQSFYQAFREMQINREIRSAAAVTQVTSPWRRHEPVVGCRRFGAEVNLQLLSDALNAGLEDWKTGRLEAKKTKNQSALSLG